MNDVKKFETELIPQFTSVDSVDSQGEIVAMGGKNRITKEYKRNDQISVYKIIERLPSGGMGRIYLCKNIYEDRLYILKTVIPQQSCWMDVQRMMKEMEHMANIPSHPNVIEMHASLMVNQVPHIIMEYAKGVNEKGKEYGSSLADLLRNKWQFSFADVLWIAMSVCRGMCHCQKYIKGFVHGDLKPENILFQPLNERAVFGEGIGKYQVMIADFGGGKTAGYYVSDRKEDATQEDDIYAFAKTMEQLFKADGFNEKTSYYWRSFGAGLKEMLDKEYGSEVRKITNFHSLYKAYAEAFEVMFGLNAKGYCTEDIIPKKDKSLIMETVEAINRSAMKISVSGDAEEAEEILCNLLKKSGVDKIYFDEMPANLIIKLNLANCYYNRRQWAEFDGIIKEMKKEIGKLSYPVRYRGYLIYSVDIKMDVDILEQSALIIRGGNVDVERLISAIKPDVDTESWLELLLEYIGTDKKEEKLKLDKHILSLEEPLGKELQLVQYHWTLATYYYWYGDYSKACPHYQFLVNSDLDRLDFVYNYALCLYNSGKIISSMQYFMRTYNICSNEIKLNWSIFQIMIISAFYLCDYEWVEGICQDVLQQTKEEAEREWIYRMIKASYACRELSNEWREIEQEMLHKYKGRQSIAMVVAMKEKTIELLAENEKTITDIRYRAVNQVFFESCEALARFFVNCEWYDFAIQECEDILRMDDTNFKGYYIRAECYMELWRKSKEEEYRKSAKLDFEKAMYYVHDMYPDEKGRKSEKAEEWEKYICERIELL